MARPALSSLSHLELHGASSFCAIFQWFSAILSGVYRLGKPGKRQLEGWENSRGEVSARWRRIVGQKLRFFLHRPCFSKIERQTIVARSGITENLTSMEAMV
jgi:hypothetical protein